MSKLAICAKSTLAGILALLVAVVGCCYAAWMALFIIASRHSGTDFVFVGFHFGHVLKSPVFWTVACVIFITAFSWRFQKLSR
jgi:uncharacterized membrane protein